MNEAEAQSIVDAYHSNIIKNTPSEYMAYMHARDFLATLGFENMTAGRRGFMAATRHNLLGRMV